jgi:hypothetical protein
MADDTAPQVSGAVNVPRYSVNAFQVFGTPTEITVLGLSQVIGFGPGGFEVGAKPAVQIGMSIAAAKELQFVLSDIVSQFEADFGPIQTPFLTEREGKK